ncbi:MAG: DUF1223 domain-containing protein [Planctomycetota bacterium]|nr:DUF1223 domain-containing protein [Planctomycetota bacterium]
MKSIIALAALVALCCGSPRAEDSAPKPQHKVLVELFTSQGCNSCPPAEKVLTQLGVHAQFGAKIVPLAWHVDYWDYIGWPDKFASPAHTQRQKDYARILKLRGLVTPQFIVANKPTQQLGQAIQTDAAKAAVLGIEVSATLKDGKIAAPVKLSKVDAAYTLDPGAVVRVVLFQAQASTKCMAGENAGKTLEESYLVLKAHEPLPAADALDKGVSASFDAPSGQAPGNLGVAVLVEVPGSMTTLECAAVPLKQE